ncbi:MAG: protein translocase SEC61 complex subunit gamma [Nanoarchaeota archaeon]
MDETQQEHINTGWTAKIQRWFQEYKRVLLVTKKPTKEEFITIVKISGLGILLIGLLGFIVQMIEYMLFK